MSDDTASASGDVRSVLAREVDFLLRHPGRTLSPQQRRLLVFLFERTSPSSRSAVSQLEISTEVLGQAVDAATGDDSRARVAVQRLRSALDRFYRLPANRGRRRLFLPKGQYRLEIASADEHRLPAPHDGRHLADPPPAIAWMIAAHPSPRAIGPAHRIGRALAKTLARAPLVQDGAIDVVQLNLTEREDPFERAAQRGAAVLVRILVDLDDNGHSISLHAYDANARQTVGDEQRFTAPAGSEPRSLARQLACALVDPLVSRVPDHLARVCPRSRLAVAMMFFRFMATQDRTRLPCSLAALHEVSGTRRASPLTDALRIDAIRASYCFATSGSDGLPLGLVDDACAIQERAPYQPYAKLAHGYIALAVQGAVGQQPASLDTDLRDAFGSLEQDFVLLDALSGHQIGLDASKRPSAGKTMFFEDAAGFITSMAKEDYCGAEAHAFASGGPENLWMCAFQAAIAVEHRRKPHAKALFDRLCRDNPGAPDYLTRALATMVPNRDVSSRLIGNITQLY